MRSDLRGKHVLDLGCALGGCTWHPEDSESRIVHTNEATFGIREVAPSSPHLSILSNIVHENNGAFAHLGNVEFDFLHDMVVRMETVQKEQIDRLVVEA